MKIKSGCMAALLVLSGTLALADGQGKTLAVYGDAAVAKTPPPGWSFLWNASGKVGESKGYSPLSYVEKCRAYGVVDETGVLKPDVPSHNISRDFFFLDISAMRDKGGIARFYIASYTLAADPAGEVWINNGNLRNQAFPKGTALEIYVNDELKSQSLFKVDRFAALFQQNLGRLKKGDAIRVAVGPGENSPQGGGRLFFTIEEYPAGEKPAAPIHILTPPLNAVNPELGADGKIHPVYAAKHQAQCKALLTNNPELVFIGDSITARWPAELLKEKFGSFRPANLGMGGDGFGNVLWRLRNGVLDKVHPKVIVLLIGTNNTGLTPDEIAQGIGLLLKTLQEKAPASKILLLGILPRGESIKEASNEKIRQTNAKLALLADNKRVFYLDVGDKLVEPDGSISREIMPDKLHVAGPGYIRWMDAMKPTLDNLLNFEADSRATPEISAAPPLPVIPHKIPVSLIVDDGAFYVHKIPNAFLRKFGEWSITKGVKGKFSIIPIYGGKKAIDGSLGEYGGTTKEERLEWIELIKTLITPRWTITPEIITHGQPWDVKNHVAMTNMPRESDWLAEQSLETQTEYITEAMQLLKNVGIEFGGLTMCWHYPPEKNHILGEATLRAAEKVQGSKFVMIFNDKGEKPAVIYKRADGAMAVSMRPALTDLLDYSDKFTEADIQRIASRFISADGSSGQFVDQIKKGVCLEFYTHYANLYSGGTYKGLEVLTIAIGRLHQFYGDKIEWMTGLDICKRFAE